MGQVPRRYFILFYYIILATLRVRIRTEKNGANQSVKLSPRLRIEHCTRIPVRIEPSHFLTAAECWSIAESVQWYSKRDFTSAFLFFLLFLLFFVSRRWPEFFPSSRRVSNLFICLFIYVFSFTCHPAVVVVLVSSSSSSFTGFVLKKTLRLGRNCLLRSRYIACEAPSFLPGVLHRHFSV